MTAVRFSPHSFLRVRRLNKVETVFENPLTLAKGKEAIADLFGLLALVPGVSWSELGDVTESQSFGESKFRTHLRSAHSHRHLQMDIDS